MRLSTDEGTALATLASCMYDKKDKELRWDSNECNQSQIVCSSETVYDYVLRQPAASSDWLPAVTQRRNDAMHTMYWCEVLPKFKMGEGASFLLETYIQLEKVYRRRLSTSLVRTGQGGRFHTHSGRVALRCQNTRTRRHRHCIRGNQIALGTSSF